MCAEIIRLLKKLGATSQLSQGHWTVSGRSRIQIYISKECRLSVFSLFPPEVTVMGEGEKL